jgi:RHS repeat-associated protein
MANTARHFAFEYVQNRIFGGDDKLDGPESLYEMLLGTLDARLLYLRARWYDPQSGTFLSGDPLEGKQQDPRSLNRYRYAQNNPVQFTDPRGEMSLGEVGSALGNVASMASRAYNTYDMVNSFLGGDESGRFGLVDALVGHLMTSMAGSAGSDVEVDPAGSMIGAALSFGTHGHHTIPKYTCGHSRQNLIKVGIRDHTVLHEKLYGFTTTVDTIGKVYTVAFKRKPKGSMSPVRSLGKSPTGRGVIGSALAIFYSNGWLAKGAGDTHNVFGKGATLGQVFARERTYFMHHYNPSCK